jgi:hypothetical protein
MGWSKADVDGSDFFELIDILESGKEKGPVPLGELNVEGMDFDAIKKEMQESGKWPQTSS